MPYFQQFPTTTYDVNKDGVIDEVTDIFRYVDVKDNAISDLATYTWYNIADGERPDVVSQKLYGTPKYYWTFFVINDSLKHGLEDWPLSHQELEKFLEYNFDSNSVVKLKTTVTPYLNEVIYAPAKGIGLDGAFRIEENLEYNFANTLNGLLLVPDVVIKNMENSDIAVIQNYDSTNNQLSVKQGTVTRITVEDAGGSYILPPDIIFAKNNTGQTAEALCALNDDGSIGLAEITATGSGYSTSPVVQVFDGPDVPAELQIFCTAGGTISTTVKIVNAGLGYRRIPRLEVSAPTQSGGTRATAACSLSATGAIESVTITSVGSGYSLNFIPHISVIVPEDSQAVITAEIVDREWVTTLNEFSLSTAFIQAKNDTEIYEQLQVQGINYAIQANNGYVNLQSDPNRKYFPRIEQGFIKSKILGSAGSGQLIVPKDYKTVARKASLDSNVSVSVVDSRPVSYAYNAEGQQVQITRDTYNWVFSSKGPITYEIKKDPLIPGDNTYYTYVTYDRSGGLNPAAATETRKLAEWFEPYPDPEQPGYQGYQVQIDTVNYPTAGWAGNIFNGNRLTSTSTGAEVPNPIFPWVVALENNGPDIQNILYSMSSAAQFGLGWHDSWFRELQYNAITGKIDAVWENYDGIIIYTPDVADVTVTNSIDSTTLLISFGSRSSQLPTDWGYITYSGYIKLTLSGLEIHSNLDGSVPPVYDHIGSYNKTIVDSPLYDNTFTVGNNTTFTVDETTTVNGYNINKLAYYGSGNSGAQSTNYNTGTNYYRFGNDSSFIINSWNYSYSPTTKPFFIPTITGSKNTYYDLRFALKAYQWDGTTVGPEIISNFYPVRFYEGRFDTGSSGTASVILGAEPADGIGPIPENVIYIASLDRAISVSPYNQETSQVINEQWYDPYAKWTESFSPVVYNDIKEKSKLPDGSFSAPLFARNVERALAIRIEERSQVGRGALCHYESLDGKYKSTGDISSLDVTTISESEYAANNDLPSPFASIPETPNFITVAECAQRENLAKTKIRVVKPEHINDFAASFRTLIQS